MTIGRHHMPLDEICAGLLHARHIYREQRTSGRAHKFDDATVRRDEAERHR
jgi:hypothetical protein